MATPTEKSPAIEAAIIDLLGVDRRAFISADTCAACRKPVTGFRDRLSRKEFTISGMCQTCQDSVFGVDVGV